jgi:AraC-like DNA-binding protein/mannose-6-phosphate isomerase-like protein (cupin superfamily)
MRRATGVRVLAAIQGAPFYAGAQTLRQDQVPHRHHDYVEIMAFVAGRGRHEIDAEDGTRRVERLEPGQIFLFRPRDQHNLVGLGEEGITIFHVAFPIPAWHAFTALAGLGDAWSTALDSPSARFDPGDPAVIRPFEVAVELFLARTATEMDLLRFWTAIVPILLSSTRGRASGPTPAWLERSLEAFREERELRGGVPRLRELSHVSATHLARAVRRHFGMTPTELVGHFQVERAALLLGSSQDGIAEIADRCGFSSPSYFSKRFHAAYGMSPRRYRQRWRSGEDLGEL